MLLLTLLFLGVNSQLIQMSVCSDFSCSSNCVSWTATAGRCNPCPDKGPCSLTNPSSIVDVGSMTLYSDASCQNVIPGTLDMTLFMDSGCKVLYAANDKKIGSYKASNTSAIVAGVIGGVFLLACGCTCAYCMCKRCVLATHSSQQVQQQPQQQQQKEEVYFSPPGIQQPYYPPPPPAANYYNNDFSKQEPQQYPQYGMQPSWAFTPVVPQQYGYPLPTLPTAPTALAAPTEPPAKPYNYL